MEPETPSPASRELDDFIRAYEATQSRTGQADLIAFLPNRDHPLYLHVLRELVRVDLEYGWERGPPKRLEEYERLFPELFQDPESVQEIAFEEYRLRQQAGQNPAPAEYQQRYGISTATWPEPPRAPDNPTSNPAKPAAGGPEKAAGEQAGLMATEATLKQLPPQHKAMWEFHLQGYEVAAIAQMTGRSKRTVERILQEARIQLGDLLEQRD